MSKDLRPVYTAATEQAAKERFGEFADTWGEQYPAIIRLWQNSWTEFVPFLDYRACCRFPSGDGVPRVVLCRWQVAGQESPWPSGGSAGRGCPVDLHEVEGGGCQVEFAARLVESAAGEPVDDLFEVADAGLHGGSTTFVEGLALLGA